MVNICAIQPQKKLRIEVEHDQEISIWRKRKSMCHTESRFQKIVTCQLVSELRIGAFMTNVHQIDSISSSNKSSELGFNLWLDASVWRGEMWHQIVRIVMVPCGKMCIGKTFWQKYTMWHMLNINKTKFLCCHSCKVQMAVVKQQNTLSPARSTVKKQQQQQQQDCQPQQWHEPNVSKQINFATQTRWMQTN